MTIIRNNIWRPQFKMSDLPPGVEVFCWTSASRSIRFLNAPLMRWNVPTNFYIQDSMISADRLAGIFDQSANDSKWEG